MIINGPRTQAGGQPNSLWPEESNAQAGLVMSLLTIESIETPTYGIKRLFGSLVWPATADEL